MQSVSVRTCSPTTRDRNLKFRAPSPLDILSFSPVDFFFVFSPGGFLCNCLISGWTMRRILSRLWLSRFSRAACLQNETAPKSFNFKTKNGPKNDPNLPRKNVSLVLLCRISHRHYSKIFHREFPHKIKYFFTTRICRHGHANDFAVLKSSGQNFCQGDFAPRESCRQKELRDQLFGSGEHLVGWGLPREGVGIKKFVPSVESLFPPCESQGKQTLSLGCGVQKVSAKKVCSQFSALSEPWVENSGIQF